MQVIPVIDLRDGLAVHAIAGDRQNYAPVKRAEARAGDARSLVAFYAARIPPAIYVADLDAIGNREPQLELWTELASLVKCPLWIDCGVRDVHSCGPLLELERRSKNTHRLILPTETLNSVCELSAIAQRVNSDQLILSLDRQHGKPLGSSKQMTEVDLLRAAESLGINKAIALDLASVGTGSASARFVQWRPILAEFPNFQWMFGGGVSGERDLQTAKQLGFSAVLSATAILRGDL